MGETERVLVVDDDDVVGYSLEAAFEDAGWEVCVVESADAALARLDEGWDALLVDKNLPGMSGVELARAARERNETMAVLMMTGYGSSDSALEMLHLRGDGYLEKPFDDIFAAVQQVHDAVARRRRTRAEVGTSDAIGHFRRASAHLQSHEPAATPAGGRCVLVATPSARDAAWLVERLTALGDRVEQASARDDLAARLRRPGLDAAILDLSLAAGDPLRWLGELIRSAPGVAFVVVSSRPPPSVVARFMELDVRAVLEKPFTDEQFDQRVAAALLRLRRVEHEPSSV